MISKGKRIEAKRAMAKARMVKITVKAFARANW